MDDETKEEIATQMQEIERRLKEILHNNNGWWQTQVGALEEKISGVAYKREAKDILRNLRNLESQISSIVNRKIKKKLEEIQFEKRVDELILTHIATRKGIKNLMQFIKLQVDEKFVKAVNKRFYELSVLKTSTLSEIKDNLQNIPVEIGDDEEFWEQLKRHDFLLMNGKGKIK